MRQHDDDAAFDLFVPQNVDLQPGRQVVDLKSPWKSPRVMQLLFSQEVVSQQREWRFIVTW